MVDSARRREQEAERNKRSHAARAAYCMKKAEADKESLSFKDQTEKLGKMKVSQMRILDSFSPPYEFE